MILATMRTSILMTMVCCLGACVTDAGPVSIGNGVYTMGSEGPGSGSRDAIDDERQRAIKFCFDQGKQLLWIDVENHSSTPSQRASGELRFQCIGPGEPGWKEPAG